MSENWPTIVGALFLMGISFWIGNIRGTHAAPEFKEAMIIKQEARDRRDEEFWARLEAHQYEPDICEQIIDLVLEYENESELLLQESLNELPGGRD